MERLAISPKVTQLADSRRWASNSKPVCQFKQKNLFPVPEKSLEVKADAFGPAQTLAFDVLK